MAIADKEGNLDWKVPARRWNCDTRPSTRRRGKKGGEEDEKLGRSRGGFSTKIHIRCEGFGKPITFLLSPGQRNESLFLEQLMEQGTVKRSGRGRPRIRPLRLVGDKGYTSRRIRNYLRRRGIRLTIPLIVY
ncbi:transposase [Calothrix sp. CCY 0018]|uniref:transposase n=1 Tax=Calothrix sp. CCY 0018 TaxID=3103864 RepID=UPI0039C731E7